MAIIGLMAGLANSEPQLGPKPYPIERYACLWAGNWLIKTPPPPKQEDTRQSVPSPSCDYQLSGIASLRNTQFVYLKEKSGTVHELTPGQRAGSLELVNIVMGEKPADHYVEVLTPQGRFQLKFDLTSKALVIPPQPVKKSAATRSKIQTSRKVKREGEDWIDNSWLNESDKGRQ